MPKFRKNPVVIEAVHFVPGCEKELDALFGDFAGHSPILAADMIQKRRIYIDTIEGKVLASDGDWIIKGVKGEFYPCRADIFHATYDHAEAA